MWLLHIQDRVPAINRPLGRLRVGPSIALSIDTDEMSLGQVGWSLSDITVLKSAASNAILSGFIILYSINGQLRWGKIVSTRTPTNSQKRPRRSEYYGRRTGRLARGVGLGGFREAEIKRNVEM